MSAKLTHNELREMMAKFRALTADADSLEEALDGGDVEKIERYASGIIDNARDIHETAEAALQDGV